MRAQGTEQRLPLLRRHVDDDDTIDPGRGRRLGEPLVSHGDDRIQITHEDQRRIPVVLAKAARELEHAGEGHAAGQGALSGALDDGSVRHRIGERNPELDDVRTGLHEPGEEAARDVRIRISGRHVGDQGGVSGFAQLLETSRKTAHPGRSSIPWRE